MWLQDAAVPEDPRAVEAAAALQEGALRREVDLLRSRAQLLAAAGRVSLRAPVGARHLGPPRQCLQSRQCFQLATLFYRGPFQKATE